MVSSSPRRRRPESAARAPRVVAHPRVSELAFRRDGTTGFPGGRRDGAIRTASDARGTRRRDAVAARRVLRGVHGRGRGPRWNPTRRRGRARGVSEPDEPVARGVEPSWRKPCRARRSPGSGPRARRLASRRGVERVHRLRRDDDAFGVACDARHGGVIVERAAVGRADSERGLLGFFRAPARPRAPASHFFPPPGCGGARRRPRRRRAGRALPTAPIPAPIPRADLSSALNTLLSGDRHRGRRPQQEEVSHRAQVRERVPQAPREAVPVPRSPHGLQGERDHP